MSIAIATDHCHSYGCYGTSRPPVSVQSFLQECYDLVTILLWKLMTKYGHRTRSWTRSEHLAVAAASNVISSHIQEIILICFEMMNIVKIGNLRCVVWISVFFSLTSLMKEWWISSLTKSLELSSVMTTYQDSVHDILNLNQSLNTMTPNYSQYI